MNIFISWKELSYTWYHMDLYPSKIGNVRIIAHIAVAKLNIQFPAII